MNNLDNGMLKKQRGQVFILVLILLAVGALLVTPALNLAWTGLKSWLVYRADLMEQFAAEGATDYSLWRLSNESGFAASLEPGVTAGPYYIILNGIKAEYSVTAQAAAGAPSDAPLSSNRYKITAIVSDPYPPLPPNLPLPGSPTTFTYTITLKYMYPDVPTQPLTQLQVQVPPRFTYFPGSGTGFIAVAEPPSRTGAVGAGYTYTWNLGSGVSFNYWEEKSVSFQATTPTSGYPSQGTYYLSVSVVPSVPTGLKVYIAPIIVGTPAETGIKRIKVTKTVSPQIIPPGVPTQLTYTISIENQSTVDSIAVQSIEDALPAGFSYIGEPPPSPLADTGFLLIDSNGPSGTYVAGGTREQWQWTFTPIGTFTINANTTVTATFQSIGQVDSSGTYANEVWVDAQGVAQEYSWPTGGVIVPQYDIESSAGGTTLKVVAEVSGGSHKIKSWQVE